MVGATSAVADRSDDPRRIRSRNRLLDAATTLLTSGGIEAVTVDAVTRLSKVARTTLYRNFGSTTDLVAAALERMLPTMPDPQPTGDIRRDLVDLLDAQDHLVRSAPVPLTTLGWLAVGSAAEGRESPSALEELRDTVIAQYRDQFEVVFDTPAGRALGDFDHGLAFAQLISPILLAGLAGDSVRVDAAGRRQLVDDFLAARETR